MSKRPVVLSLSALALVALPALAYAGYVSHSPIEVFTYPTSLYINGSMEGVRRSADTNQQIGCYTADNAGGTTAVCAGRDASGKWFYCSTSDAGRIATARAINATSTLHLEIDTTTSECTNLVVSNVSSSVR